MFVAVVVIVGCLLLYGIVRKIFKKSNNRDLEGKHVVVTGGSSGIGKEIAIEAISLGAHVTIISRNAGNLEKVLGEIRKYCKDQQKQKIQYLALDVTGDYEKTREALVSLEDNVAPIYMLVNCAGMATCGRLEDLGVNDIRHMINLNYFGSAFPTKALLGGMKSRGEGIIVFVSSQAALIGIFGYGVYGAGKWAIRGLAESLLMEVVGSGVSVTVAYPPDTDTPGFHLEETTKPIETKLISQSGGLVSPKTVAKQIVKDALNGEPQSYIGLESWMLSTLCITTWNGMRSAFLQALLLGPLRLIFATYQIHFRSIILRCRREKEISKKAE